MNILKLTKNELIELRSIKGLYEINNIKLFIFIIKPLIFITLILIFEYYIRQYLVLSLILNAIFALIIGFWIHNYTLLIHEAAHYNLHNNKRINDIISNSLILPFTGLEIKAYRKSHWKHHLHLGSIEDTEISYRENISFTAILSGIFGNYLISSFKRYSKNYKKINTKQKLTNSLFIPVIVMISFQLFISLSLYFNISFLSAFYWLVSVFVIAPLFARIRQTLEHRPTLSNKYDGMTADNFIFGNDFFSKNFGAFGFNNHLIHHLDPKIPSTNIDIAKKFLLNSSIGPYIKSRQSGYIIRLKELLV